ncbi:hypothetical protein ROHU_005105 [Labeo rohita]|uniref:Uncharacterized protein n=1 Tax=Labeo rohita TaxID=84645 RepID=A0A498NE52_LABRO|nr:hypothetical protein ROHU_005105 [Labeo rohita]
MPLLGCTQPRSPQQGVPRLQEHLVRGQQGSNISSPERPLQTADPKDGRQKPSKATSELTNPTSKKPTKPSLADKPSQTPCLFPAWCDAGVLISHQLPREPSQAGSPFSLPARWAKLHVSSPRLVQRRSLDLPSVAARALLGRFASLPLFLAGQTPSLFPAWCNARVLISHQLLREPSLADSPSSLPSGPNSMSFSPAWCNAGVLISHQLP